MRLRNTGYLLYRRVIEIRDAQLALRPFVDTAVAAEASRAAMRHGSDPEDAQDASEVAVLTAVLTAALTAHAENRPMKAPRLAPHGGTTLAEETAGLAGQFGRG